MGDYAGVMPLRQQAKAGERTDLSAGPVGGSSAEGAVGADVARSVPASPLVNLKGALDGRAAVQSHLLLQRSLDAKVLRPVVQRKIRSGNQIFDEKAHAASFGEPIRSLLASPEVHVTNKNGGMLLEHGIKGVIKVLSPHHHLIGEQHTDSKAELIEADWAAIIPVLHESKFPTLSGPSLKRLAPDAKAPKAMPMENIDVRAIQVIAHLPDIVGKAQKNLASERDTLVKALAWVAATFGEYGKAEFESDVVLKARGSAASAHRASVQNIQGKTTGMTAGLVHAANAIKSGGSDLDAVTKLLGPLEEVKGLLLAQVAMDKPQSAIAGGKKPSQWDDAKTAAPLFQDLKLTHSPTYEPHYKYNALRDEYMVKAILASSQPSIAIMGQGHLRAIQSDWSDARFKFHTDVSAFNKAITVTLSPASQPVPSVTPHVAEGGAKNDGASAAGAGSGAGAAMLAPAATSGGSGAQSTKEGQAGPVQLARSSHGEPPPAGGTTMRATGGLPAGLRAGIEHLSGLAMDDVRVHYNSPKPASVQAYAYAQGAEIHLAPGQERHLAHEAWHVVQQKQGRVKPTLQLKGFAINDDAGLEREADVMGSRAVRVSGPVHSGRVVSEGGAVVQRLLKLDAKVYNPRQEAEIWPEVAAILEREGHSRWGRRKKFSEDLRDVDVVNPKATTFAAYVTWLVERTPRASEQGRGRPEWDGFWKSINTNWLHRRHIVMSSVMRNAVYAVTDKVNAIAAAPGKAKARDALAATYVQLAGSGDAKNLEVSEAALVSRLHNHKLNIFIGEGSWNSAIGGLSHSVDAGSYMHDLEGAVDLKAVEGVKDRFLESLRAAGVFGHEGPKKEVLDVAVAMLKKVGTDWKGRPLNAPLLERIKEETFEIIETISDSTTTDVSEAGDDKIRAHHNKLFHFNVQFQNIAASGSSAELAKTVQAFLQQEESIPGSQPMTGIDFFKAITSKKLAGRVSQNTKSKNAALTWKQTVADIKKMTQSPAASAALLSPGPGILAAKAPGQASQTGVDLKSPGHVTGAPTVGPGGGHMSLSSMPASSPGVVLDTKLASPGIGGALAGPGVRVKPPLQQPGVGARSGAPNQQTPAAMSPAVMTGQPSPNKGAPVFKLPASIRGAQPRDADTKSPAQSSGPAAAASGVKGASSSAASSSGAGRNRLTKQESRTLADAAAFLAWQSHSKPTLAPKSKARLKPLG